MAHVLTSAEVIVSLFNSEDDFSSGCQDITDKQHFFRFIIHLRSAVAELLYR